MKPLYYIVSSLIFALLVSCDSSQKDSNLSANTNTGTGDRISVSKAQFQRNNMSLGSIGQHEFPETIKVNGMIDVPPENKALVSAIKGGYIKSIPVLVGDKVNKGQMLLVIENPEFIQLQQDYMEIKEQLNYLESEYKRQQTMLEENITSEKSFLKAKSQFKTASAKYNGLKNQLSLLNISPKLLEQGKISSTVTIYAPISGSVTKVEVSKGTYASPSTPILEIIDNNHIHLELSVFEKDIMKIKKGQTITFKIPEISAKQHDATVYLVGTSLQDNRTIKVHAHPTDESQRFLTGMFVNAQIKTDSKVSQALPQNAIIENQGEYYVLILDEEVNNNYYFRQKNVTIGKTYEAFTEILESSKINASDKILVNGAFSLIGN